MRHHGSPSSMPRYTQSGDGARKGGAEGVDLYVDYLQNHMYRVAHITYTAKGHQWFIDVLQGRPTGIRGAE